MAFGLHHCVQKFNKLKMAESLEENLSEIRLLFFFLDIASTHMICPYLGGRVIVSWNDGSSKCCFLHRKLPAMQKGHKECLMFSTYCFY
jgi:hypothetical protein